MYPVRYPAWAGAIIALTILTSLVSLPLYALLKKLGIIKPSQPRPMDTSASTAKMLPTADEGDGMEMQEEGNKNE